VDLFRRPRLPVHCGTDEFLDISRLLGPKSGGEERHKQGGRGKVTHLIFLPEAVFKTTESIEVRIGWDCDVSGNCKMGLLEEPLDNLPPPRLENIVRNKHDWSGEKDHLSKTDEALSPLEGYS
jgi:hypothetical protein